MSDPIITYYENGNIWVKIWKDQNDIPHNDKGPAYIKYFNGGPIAEEWYFKDGKIHRIYGPSRVIYYPNGKILENNWNYEGITYTDEVNKWLTYNKINYQKMSEDDFNRMWFEII